MKLRRAAFTIVECVLALGIVSSLLLVIVALLPVGMDATRSAAHNSTESVIVQRIRQQCERDGTLPAGDLYFDDQGVALPGRTADAVFAVRLEMMDGAILPGDVEPSMRRISILISDRAHDAPFADERRLRRHHLLLAPVQKSAP